MNKLMLLALLMSGAIQASQGKFLLSNESRNIWAHYKRLYQDLLTDHTLPFSQAEEIPKSYKNLPLTALVVSTDKTRYLVRLGSVPIDQIKTVVFLNDADKVKVKIILLNGTSTTLTLGNGLIDFDEWQQQEAKKRAVPAKEKGNGDKGDDKRQQAEASELPSAPGGMGWSGGVEKLQKQLDDCLKQASQLAEENKKLKEQYEFQAKTLKDRVQKLTSENNTLRARVKELEDIARALGER